MQKDFGVLALLVFGCACAGGAQDHLVEARAVPLRMAQSAAGRERDVAIVSQALDSEGAKRAASALGTSLPRLRAGLEQLSDADLTDLAVRASALREDPAAGLSREANEFLVIFLIVAIVILVLKAAG
ncbi:MAG TPA: hypothetical protein VN083_00850 [Vicinamibacteria bacterium]|nr:hypothetical protein [Vicinamibacteria bacterium]